MRSLKQGVTKGLSKAVNGEREAWSEEEAGSSMSVSHYATG